MNKEELLFKQNPVYRFSEVQTDLLESALKQYLAQPEPEYLKLLRHTLKKLEGFASVLVWQELLEVRQAWPTHFSIFYKLIGKTRRLHLKRLHIIENGWDLSLPGAHKKLLKKQIKLHKLIQREGKEILPALNAWTEALKNQAEKVDQARLEEKLRIEKISLMNLISNHKQVKNWHDIRKALKAWKYKSEMLSIRSQARAREEMDMKKFEHLQKCLSIWHETRLPYTWAEKKNKKLAEQKPILNLILDKEHIKLQKAADLVKMAFADFLHDTNEPITDNS